MSLRSLVSEILDKARAIIIKKQSDSGIRASGRSATTIRKVAKDNGGQLFGEDYFQQQFVGRRPGKFPPIEAIENWIRVKGITPDNPNTSTRSLAFLFARAIAKNGTKALTDKSKRLDPSKELGSLREEYAQKILNEIKFDIIRDQQS